MNEYCKNCKQAYPTINGLFCKFVKQKVEYTKEPLCKTSIKIVES